MSSDARDPSDYCTLDTCPLSEANFTYVPTLAGNATYLAFFALLLPIQLFLGIRYRTWGFLAGMTGGLVLEIIGYVGRIQLHFNPFPFDPFLEYLICLTIGPAFLSAAIYLCLSRIVVAYGERVSRLRPRTYAIFFVCCDFVSLVLQAAGGAITATADHDKKMNDLGIDIMIAGLASQVASLAIFMALGAEFAVRCWRDPGALEEGFRDVRRGWVWKGFLGAIALATTTIFVRCVYRLVELQEGFDGELANDEVIFMVLEGPMIIIACIALTVFHPGVCFRGMWAEANWSFGKGKQSLSACRHQNSR
ncbi:putative RTA1 domain protein [Macrophomina phaseolina]|uniref:RTA1 domain protein n=1 Tax=Macrophomina phaseolina TaxID=35725 RepID=A0ABQ8FRL2_9PEZI|nr:putative RTA1 domain protein [Macrophomina phaseolina]